jgi:hypothetical protein
MLRHEGQPSALGMDHACDRLRRRTIAPHYGNLRAQCWNGRLIAGSQTSMCHLALQRLGNPVILLRPRSLQAQRGQVPESERQHP